MTDDHPTIEGFIRKEMAEAMLEQSGLPITCRDPCYTGKLDLSAYRKYCPTGDDAHTVYLILVENGCGKDIAGLIAYVCRSDLASRGDTGIGMGKQGSDYFEILGEVCKLEAEKRRAVRAQDHDKAAQLSDKIKDFLCSRGLVGPN